MAHSQGTPAGSDDDASDEAFSEDFAFDREGERCISTRNIRHTDILDERTILFRMRGGDYFVNYLRHDCRSLLREERFYRNHPAVSSGWTRSVIEGFRGFIPEGMSCRARPVLSHHRGRADFLALEPEERRGGPPIRVSNPNDGQEEDEAADEGEDAETGESGE